MDLELQQLTKRFGAFPAIEDVSLQVPSGALVALLGPSGSGKTTVLRAVAGLEWPEAGRILLDGRDITYLPPQRRNFGLVFQHYALFDHLTVFENIAFGLRVRRQPGDVVRERVQELLGFVRLEGLGERFPSQLSGGQRQRVALARALAIRPQLLLLDEPFGALDAKVRTDLRKWLRRLHEKFGLTSLFVTHDQQEAFEVADEVVVMNRGHVEQSGTPEELFERPATAFVADFLGDANVLHGCASSGRASFGGLEVPYPDYASEQPRPARAYLRNQEMLLQKARGNEDGSLTVQITQAKRTGPAVKLVMVAQLRRSTLHLELRPEEWERLGLDVGDLAYVLPRRLAVFLGEEGEQGCPSGRGDNP